MVLRILAAVALLFSAGLAAMPALAQGNPFSVEAGADWTHGPSGIVVPTAIDGFERGELRDLSPNRHDIFIQYSKHGSDTLATLYIYRTGYRDVSVWFAQAYAAMRTNPVVALRAGDDRAPDLIALSDSGAPDTGIVAFDIDGDFRTTGLGLTERDGWLIKVRLSSKRLDREENQAQIRRLLSDLNLPQRTGDAALPVPMTECDTHIGDEAAEAIISPPSTLAVIGPMMLSMAISEIPPPSCFDAQLSQLIGVYHPVGQTAPYIVALGDSGKAAYVTPLPAELAADAWMVALLITDRAVVAGYFTGMPSPGQATEMATAVLSGQSAGLGALVYPQGDEGPVVEISPGMIPAEEAQ